jgi:hypothetical protein
MAGDAVEPPLRAVALELADEAIDRQLRHGHAERCQELLDALAFEVDLDRQRPQQRIAHGAVDDKIVAAEMAVELHRIGFAPVLQPRERRDRRRQRKRLLLEAAGRRDMDRTVGIRCLGREIVDGDVRLGAALAVAEMQAAMVQRCGADLGNAAERRAGARLARRRPIALALGGGLQEHRGLVEHDAPDAQAEAQQRARIELQLDMPGGEHVRRRSP